MLLGLILAASTAQAAPPEPNPDAKKKIVESIEEIERAFERTSATPGYKAPREKTDRVFWIEHRGMFRFRPDFLFRGHLDTHTFVNGQTVGTSRVPPPITENFVNNEGNPFDADAVGGQDDDTLAGVNIRFRYEPILHIASSLRLGAQLDLLDNLVLGSTPIYGNYSAPLAIFSQGQEPPMSGVNGWADSVRVKQAYGVWDMPLGTLRVGRQSFHWGLGMVHNAGAGYDDNYGDYVDRALWQVRVPHFNLYTQLMWDYVATGPTSDQASEFLGQAYDATRQDDVRQFGVSIFRRALTEKERATRYQRIHHLGKAYWEWGLLYQFRTQTLLPDQDEASNQAGAGARDAMLHLPDLWLSMHMKPSVNSYFTLDLELALVYGNISNGITDGSGNDAQDILQYGLATRMAYTTTGDQFTLGLDAGFASGDDQGEQGISGLVDPERTGFQFDRDFKVDQILFREVLGSIHNAYYIKPWVQWDFIAEQDVDFALRADLEYAGAVQAAATPSGSSTLGYELDVSVFYLEAGRLQAGISAALLFPGGALDLVMGYQDSLEAKEADWAMRFHGHLVWMY